MKVPGPMVCEIEISSWLAEVSLEKVLTQADNRGIDTQIDKLNILMRLISAIHDRYNIPDNINIRRFREEIDAVL